tara:strand:- start:51519 stop:52211 length:693 start_codon:yes stop_codon:yes gene_type:complete
MNYEINNHHIFFPQRIVSIEDGEVSGTYLGNDDIKTLKVGKGFEHIVQAQSQSKLPSNNQDTPHVVVLHPIDSNPYVISEKTKKLLFCQSYTEDGFLFMMKAGKAKSFSLDEKDECEGYVRSFLQKDVPEDVEVNIDGSLLKLSQGDEVSLPDFLNASVTPYLKFKYDSIFSSSERCFSLVILDTKDGLSCIERFVIKPPTSSEAESANKESGLQTSVGLEAYFSKLKGK